jgi:hypothetical protein
MRRTLLTVAIVLASGSAMASSIELIRGNRTVSCSACPALERKVNKQQTTAPLAVGMQNISIRDVKGTKQILRTDAWLGGSPVTFVSSNPVWLSQDPSATANAETTSPGTDAVKTSAVSPAPQEADTPHVAPLFADAPLRPTM